MRFFVLPLGGDIQYFRKAKKIYYIYTSTEKIEQRCFKKHKNYNNHKNGLLKTKTLSGSSYNETKAVLVTAILNWVIINHVPTVYGMIVY